MKRATARVSLTRPLRGQIVTAEAMYEFLSDEFVSDIIFKFVSNERVISVRKSLQERFSRAVTVKGTQRFHRFVPLDDCSLHAFDISSMSAGKRVRVRRT